MQCLAADVAAKQSATGHRCANMAACALLNSNSICEMVWFQWFEPHSNAVLQFHSDWNHKPDLWFNSMELLNLNQSSLEVDLGLFQFQMGLQQH